MQERVRERFSDLQKMDEADGRVPWHVVNAAQSVENVESDIWKIVSAVQEKVTTEKRMNRMWQEGSFEWKKAQSETESS